MLERKLLNNWVKFWSKRQGKQIDEHAFYLNAMFLKTRATMHFPEGNLKDLKSLEVGCGRSIMSDYLYGCGMDTHTIDKYYIPPDNGRNHKFCRANAFDIPYPDHFFDIVFTYGLLEHYESVYQIKLIKHMRSKVKKTGLNIHYVVPKKLTNIFEDKDVYRDKCFSLRSLDVIWVYPALKGLIEHFYNKRVWETNKWLGKGFWYEDPWVGYR